MAKSKKNKNKPKLNLTVREEQRNKLEQMASLEKRSQQTARNCAEQFSILSPGEKCESKKAMVEILSFSLELGLRLRRGLQRANNLDCRRTSAATESVSIAAAHKRGCRCPSPLHSPDHR
jgi:hypothetical protein